MAECRISPRTFANQDIAARASQVFVRQRMEGENDVGSLVMAILTEMQSFDFSNSFYGEFTVANAVSDRFARQYGHRAVLRTVDHSR